MQGSGNPEKRKHRGVELAEEPPPGTNSRQLLYVLQFANAIGTAEQGKIVALHLDCIQEQ